MDMLSVTDRIAILPFMSSLFKVLFYSFLERGFGGEYFYVIGEVIPGYCANCRKVVFSYAFCSWDLEGI